MTNTSPATSRANGYRNGLLTAAVALLAVLAMNNLSGVPSGALAADRQGPAPEAAPGFPNAAEQRARMIAAMERLDQRMQKIETRLTSGPLEVRVIEMPEVTSAE